MLTEELRHKHTGYSNDGEKIKATDIDWAGYLFPAGIPTGTIMPYGGTTAPIGYLMANGQAVSRTDYGDLFLIYGTVYGVGDGSTTFNLPDPREKVIVTKGFGTFATLGATGGAETHTLTTAQIPVHNHELYTGVSGGFTYDHILYSATDGDGNGGSGDIYSGFTKNAGSGNSHNNLQPYIVLNAIIKT